MAAEISREQLDQAKKRAGELALKTFEEALAYDRAGNHKRCEERLRDAARFEDMSLTETE
ncbi:hypothetical protein IPM62_02385 [Candidatus Woesebacteria bacterium]|nr:MAG: hypothetical protein IPM62_02385 [Candidatus Woesebacteria bacterium]